MILSLSCWLSDDKATEKTTQVRKCRKPDVVTVAKRGQSELPPLSVDSVAKRAEAAEKYFRVKKSVAKRTVSSLSENPLSYHL
ncbi:hypothetical protein A2U01_0037991 [Trifolium medium]|uniref:Uncharacterized protein n=1 Tax=Trifolium medium TaxID=97028 RepID=A0A392PYP6_9FABA|nr:hypothetical protein [Trifolium medium]